MSRFKTLLRFFLLCAPLVMSCNAGAQQINFVNADFSLNYNGKLTEGKNHLHIQRNADQYTIRFDMDHWLATVKQTAQFSMYGCQVKAKNYQSTSKRPFSDLDSQALQFDWNQNRVQYTHNNEKSDMALTLHLYDPISFFFEARCQLMAGQTEFAFPVIHKGKPKTHRYRIVGEEKVQTTQGTYDALVVERIRSSKSRKTQLYVAPELNYLLVKIVHQESRFAKIEATLNTMDYQVQN